MNAMSPVPADHPLMKAWSAYQETDDFKNTFKWATTAILIAHETSAPEANRVDPIEARERRAMGCLWGAFMAGFNVDRYEPEQQQQRETAAPTAQEEGWREIGSAFEEAREFVRNLWRNKEIASGPHYEIIDRIDTLEKMLPSPPRVAEPKGEPT